PAPQSRAQAPPTEVIEVAAVGLGALVFRVLLGQRREVAAALDLLQDGLGLFANRGVFLALGLEQDVARLDLFRRLILLDVVVVVPLDVGRWYGDLETRLVAIDEQVFDLTLLSDAVLRF